MVRFVFIGLGAAAIMTPSVYGLIYSWAAFKEIAPMHRAIDAAEDADADRFRWPLDANPAYSGAWKHLATDPQIPISIRFRALASFIASHVARTDESDAVANCALGHEGLASVVQMPRAHATAIENLQTALDMCSRSGLRLPHRSVVELERRLADALDESCSIEAAKAAVLQHERLLDSLLPSVSSDLFARTEFARSAKRAGEIARSLSRQQLVSPPEQQSFRMRAENLLLLSLRASLGLPVFVQPTRTSVAPAGIEPATRLRDWWWPFRWLIGPPQSSSQSARPQPQTAEIAEHLRSAPADISPSLARSVVMSAGLLAALSVRAGDLAGAEMLTTSAIAFLRRHVDEVCTPAALRSSPSCSLHGHWMNVNDAALHNNLAELSASRSLPDALQLATSAALEATAESIALRSTFPSLLHDRGKLEKLFNTAGDPLEPLRRSVQDTVAAADRAAISAHMLNGAFHELSGDATSAVAAYHRAKRAAAGPAIDRDAAVAEETMLDEGLPSALYDVEWSRANTCARRAMGKVARFRGEEPPSLPARRVVTPPWRQRLPQWLRDGPMATAFIDFVEEQYAEARWFLGKS